jgi:hypothetical protein
MRVSFPPGAQKRFLEYAKSHSGLSWRRFRRSVGISNHVNYRYEKCSLPFWAFGRILKVSGLSIKRARDFGYRIVNSKIVSQSRPSFIKLARNASLAELVGICLGDGYLTPRSLAIFGGKSGDTEYLVQHVAPLISHVAGMTPKLNTHRHDENFLALYSTAVSRSLNRVGMPYGDKIANHARIPRWVLKRNSLLQSCLRGLFDTDGCIYGFKRRPPARGSKAVLSLEFGLGSHLAKDAYRAFRRLGYSPRMMPHRNECRLGWNKDIVRFMNEVKPLNGKHRSQFLRWHGPVV